MTQKETIFKRRVIKDLRTLPRCYFIKTQERSRRGVPDMYVCLVGHFLGIELKAPGEKPEPLQDVILSRIRKAGGVAFWTNPDKWPHDFQLLKELEAKAVR